MEAPSPAAGASQPSPFFHPSLDQLHRSDIRLPDLADSFFALEITFTYRPLWQLPVGVVHPLRHSVRHRHPFGIQEPPGAARNRREVRAARPGKAKNDAIVVVHKPREHGVSRIGIHDTQQPGAVDAPGWGRLLPMVFDLGRFDVASLECGQEHFGLFGGVLTESVRAEVEIPRPAQNLETHLSCSINTRSNLRSGMSHISATAA